MNMTQMLARNTQFLFEVGLETLNTNIIESYIDNNYTDEEKLYLLHGYQTIKQ